MENRFLKFALVCVCVGLLAAPLFGQRGRGGSGGGGGSTACAIVTAPTLSTSTASSGDSVGVFSRVTNCSTGKGRYTITVSAMSSCGEETVIASSVISFSGGESKLISVPYVVAPATCYGISTVFVETYSGSSMLASGSASLMIQ
jgi:hypothetical protein